MDAKTLSVAAGVNLAIAELWAVPLAEAMREFAITTLARQAEFLGQLGHESDGFRSLTENLNYSAQRLAAVWPSRFALRDGQPNARAVALNRNPQAIANAVYADRLGNGPESSGDGWKYRGRGLVQLTGRANYRAAGTALNLPLLANPDLVAIEPAVAARTAAWFWFSKGLNSLADEGKTTAITKAINGGTVGLDDRLARVATARRALA